MASYSFDEDMAVKYGVNEAIFLNNVIHWLKKNAIEGRNMHEGRPWTFNTHKQYSEILSWLSAPQVRRIIAKLRDDDVIITSQKSGTDRKTYISVVDLSLLGEEANSYITSPSVDSVPCTEPSSTLEDTEPSVVYITDKKQQVLNTLNYIPPPSAVEAETQEMLEEIEKDLEQPIKDRVHLCYSFAMHELKARPSNSSLTNPPSWKKTLLSWLGALDKLERLDGVGVERLAKIHRKVVRDEFWSKQIRAIPKYRQKDSQGQPYFERMAYEMGV